MSDEERIYTPKRDETAGLALFDQRLASPDAHDEPRPVPRVATAKGSRGTALDRLEPKRESQKARILNIYAAIGPCTRNVAASVLCGADPATPEAMNTVQGRTAELKTAGRVRVVGYDPDHHRELIAVVPPTYLTPAPESA